MNLIEQAKRFATQKHVLDNHQLYGPAVDSRDHGPRNFPYDANGYNPRRWSFTFEQHAGPAAKFANENFDISDWELAERMAVAWGERAQQLEKWARKGEELPRKELRWNCGTCRVGPGQRCQPVHDGERDAGDWIHPIRTVEPKLGADPGNMGAIRPAMEIENHAKRGLVPAAFQGLPRHIQEIIESLAVEVMNAHRQREMGMWSPQTHIDASKITPELIARIKALDVSRAAAKAVILDSISMDPSTVSDAVLDQMAKMMGVIRDHSEGCPRRASGNPVDCDCGF